jgi:septum formation inhibitor MinC
LFGAVFAEKWWQVPNGDERAVICALEIKPLQLRIANNEAKKGVQIKNPVKINCQEKELNFTEWKQ